MPVEQFGGQIFLSEFNYYSVLVNSFVTDRVSPADRDVGRRTVGAGLHRRAG